MDNKKILIGAGILGVAGYLYWKSTQKKGFYNATGSTNTQAKCTELLTVALRNVRFSDQATLDAFKIQFMAKCMGTTTPVTKLIKYKVTLPNGYNTGSWLDKVIFKNLNSNMPSRFIGGYVWGTEPTDALGQNNIPFRKVALSYGIPFDCSQEYSLAGYQIPLGYLQPVLPNVSGC
jgi:hypothetical protein